MKTCNIKPIILTPDERMELISICNSTWPKLLFVFWGDYECEESDYLGYNYEEIKTDKTFETKSLSIHWFEFLVQAVCELEIEALEHFYYKIIDR